MAKKNEVEVGVKVTDKGSLKETGNKAKKAGKGLGEVGANAAGADRAMKGLSAQSSNSTKNFSKMSQGLTGGLVPAYAVLAANIFALGAAFRFLSNAADYRILIEGQREYSTITGESLKLLTSRLQAATEGQLAFGEASQSVAIARAAGITADQIGRLGTLAKNASIALGRDLTDSLNRLIRGATKGEPELLDELGIILRLEVAAKKYAAQIGKSAEQLSIFEKSQAVTNEVLEQGERKFQDFQTEVNQFGKMLKSFDDLLNSLKKTLAALFEPIATGLSKNVTALAGAFVLLGSSILKSLTPAIPAMNMGVVGKDAMSNIGNVYTAKGRGARFQAGTATSADITAFEKSLKSKHSTVIKYEVLKRGEMQKTVAIVKAYRQQMDADQAVGMKKIYLQWKANLALMQAEYGKFVGAIKILQRGLLGLVGAAGWISLIVTGISLLSGWFSKGTEEQEKFNDKQRQTVDLLKEQAEETARLTREMKNMKNISVNFVTGSGAAKMLKKLNYKINDVYKPPSFIVENGILNNQTKWLWNYFQYYKNCKKISEKIIKINNSDLIISDEDFASLTVAQNLKIPNILITDVLETKFTKGIASLIERKMNKSMMNIIKNCDVVIIPEEGYDQGNIKRVGPIVREINFSREELREKFSFNKTTIIISIGGTDAGLFLIEKSIESILKINQDIEIVVVSGPAISKKFSNVRNLGFVDNLHELIFASDLIISLAGKSTIDEAKAYGTPGIFIPIKGHFEQEDNAKTEGFIFEDINRLETLISEKLEQKRNKINTNGAKLASEIIKKMIKERSNS